ncbi:CpsD/CapB family tyrosine-protein kinase [Atopococcus tabaci]|uniref:CpsD/CapB family tyrosine-protein kinase n=1 Tax=Atopococcus tabaci TaxID=269774 RepID=UPI00041B3332|nr:CpsD/CapB family tyrosine-protein kinase [Atopococcus tabaci]
MFGKKKKKNESSTRAGLVVVNKPKSVISEQYRTIRTNVQFSMVDQEFKSIVITSDAPGAGKSLTSANLAATFASEDKRVLLVDADMRKPTVHNTFRVRNTDGLTTILTDRHTQLQDKIYKTSVDNLYILTSGPIPPNPAEMLSSERMDRLQEEMESLFDLVIFDTPPLTAVTDAQIMAGKTDGVIFIVRNKVAIKEQILESKQLLEMVGANVIGAVMNRIDKKEDSYYYYYGNGE